MEKIKISLPGVELFIPGEILSELIKKEVMEGISSIRSQFQKSEPETLLTRKEAAFKLGVSLQTIHEWLKSGKLIGHRVGTRIRIKEADLQSSLKKMQPHE